MHRNRREALAVGVVQIMARGKGKRLSDQISERTEDSNQIAVVFFFAVAVVAKGGDGKLNLLAFMFSNVIFKI